MFQYHTFWNLYSLYYWQKSKLSFKSKIAANIWIASHQVHSNAISHNTYVYYLVELATGYLLTLSRSRWGDSARTEFGRL